MAAGQWGRINPVPGLRAAGQWGRIHPVPGLINRKCHVVIT